MIKDDGFEKQCNSCGKVYASKNDFSKEGTDWKKCSNGKYWFNCKCKTTMIVNPTNEEQRHLFESIVNIELKNNNS